MRLLLDTHVLLWWLDDDHRLRPKSRAVIAASETEAMFSIVSCWEASVKYRVGKLDANGTTLWQFASEQGLRPMGLEAEHLFALDKLPKSSDHNDPFDHLLLAQAKAEGALLMTGDRKLTQYGVPCLGVR